MKKTPIKRSPLPVRRTAVKRKRATPRRVSVDRDPAYLNWLRERGCLLRFSHGCERFGLHGLIVDPAHGPVNGTGSKGPDSGAIGLCRMHHQRQHEIGWPAFEKEYGFSREKEAAALQAVYRIARETGEAPKE